MRATQTLVVGLERLQKRGQEGILIIRLMMAANDLLNTDLLVSRASQQPRLVRERVFQSGVF